MSFIEIIPRSIAMESTVESLGLPHEVLDRPDGIRNVIAQSLRRTAYCHTPCTVREWTQLVQRAISSIVTDVEALHELIIEVGEFLIAIGDVFEMEEHSQNGGTVIRPAPPSFIVLRPGLVAILGVAGDQIDPPLDTKITHTPSGIRTLEVDDVNKCRDELTEEGLIELPKAGWLGAPRPASAKEFADRWISCLETEVAVQNIQDARILGAPEAKYYYNARWTDISSIHTGHFIGRRPRKYGADFWVLYALKNGRIESFVDIHPGSKKLRSCDEAWRLLAALDSLQGRPPIVETHTSEQTALLRFFAPIPVWAQRRILTLGMPVDNNGCLLAFEIPFAELESLTQWLTETLWIAIKNGGTS